MEYVVGVVVGAIVLAVLTVGGFVYHAWREGERMHREVLEKGDPFVAYVLMANNVLYAKGDDHGAHARVLVAFEPESPELHRALLDVVERLLATRGREPATEAEKAAVATASDESFRAGRVRMPDEFTGGRAVYSYDLFVERELLPNGVLDRPYVRVKAIPGERGLLAMIPYPPDDRFANPGR